MIGLTISHYKITSKLGEGGMGEVYRATDTKLNRDVALKVLPEAFAADRERMVRFSREAQVLASLNHPNIASIYGLEDSDNKHALVLELVDGETLAERIQKGAIPLEESLKIALQIAEALEAAHEKGIIHRDLKPANVKLTPEGKVKVLDFGLAKAMKGEVLAVTDLTSSPTRTGTAVGVIMGTAGYMSPEQARGQPVDKRTDIWAFGCVLYEMLTGKQVFSGETATDILGAIVHKDPDWEVLPEGTPRAIQRLLRRCLEKDLRDRLRHIGDAGIEAKEALSEPFVVAPLAVEAPLPRSSWRQVLPWLLFAVTIFTLTWTLIDSGEVLQQSGTTRFLLLPPKTVTRVGGPIVSPDGRQILFYGFDDAGKASHWVRRMDSPIPQRLDGLKANDRPFWSPDSRFIAFSADDKLKRIDPTGGPAVSLADAPDGGEGTWSRHGTILFTSGSTIYGVSAAGGEPTAITQLDKSRQESFHQAPCFLPDGQHFLLKVWTQQAGEPAIHVGSLDSNETKFLVKVASHSHVAYASPGYLLFVRDDVLLAQPFDENRLQMSGEAFPIAEQMGNGSFFSVSENGVLVYQPRGLDNQLVWRDRSGKPMGTLGEPGGYVHLALSPSEKRAAVAKKEGSAKADIWLIELSTGIFSRFTFDPHNDANPNWSPDGRSLTFRSNRNGPPGLFQKSVGSSELGLLFESEAGNYPKAWSREGHILFLSVTDKGPSLYALPVGDKQKEEPILLLEDSGGKDDLQLSPDEKWIAYHSSRSGQREVYIAAFPDFSNERQVSRAGGVQARWRGDGKELFFLQLDGRLMSVGVKLGDIIETGIPRVLFEASAKLFPNHQYCVSGDGQRFLFIEQAKEATEPIYVVLNWFEELKRLVPTEN